MLPLVERKVSAILLTSDSGGLSAVGNLSVTVNAANPPVFLSSPFAEPPVTAGHAYSATLATNASDPNFGAVLNFTKFSGPAWLNIAANGSLSGLPVSTNVGNNFFLVNVADGTGLSSYAVMSVNVTLAAPLVLNIAPQGGNLMLSWTGGAPPYQVIVSDKLTSSGWQNVGGPTTATNMMVLPTSSGAFYQVHSQ